MGVNGCRFLKNIENIMLIFFYSEEFMKKLEIENTEKIKYMCIKIS